MNATDLFDKLIAIDDPLAQTELLKQIESENPEVAATLRDMLANFAPSDSFLETPAVEQIAQQTDGEDFLKAIESRFQEPKRYSESDLSLDFLSPPSVSGTLGNLAGYEIHEVIGYGGSGMVLRAKDPGLNKWFAIKVMHADQVRDTVARSRFMQEARSLGRIDHENIVRVYRVEESPVPFLVMELVQGTSLDRLIDRGSSMRLDLFLSIAIQIARGLEIAHEHGLVHRDVKPGNIMLTDDGSSSPVPRVAKLTDFGLARQASDLRLTVAGSIVGTPMYMSPEQIKDDTIDLRSDLFSLGTVYYEMIAGRPPFRGSNHYFVMNSIVDEAPESLIGSGNSIPDSLEKVILKLLEKDPSTRYQSAKEVIAALESLDRPMDSFEKPEGKRFERVLRQTDIVPLMILTGLVVTSAIAAILWLPRAPEVTPQPTAAVEPFEGLLPKVASKEQSVRDTVKFVHPMVGELRIPFDHAKANEYQRRWGELLGIETQFVNSIGIEMVLVPPGDFLMGYPVEELQVSMDNTPYQSEKQSLQSAGTLTWVRVSSPFYISKYEISEAERFRAIGSDHMEPSVLDLEYEQTRPRSRSEEHPVTRVPWMDAVLFCQRLNKKEQRESGSIFEAQDPLHLPSYRLPTETEWEWACRGGRSGSGINDHDTLLSEAWIEQNSEKQVRHRGLKSANPFGLYDMIGNTQEWCLDTFHQNFFVGNTLEEPILVDPLVRNDDANFAGWHVLRGGAAIFGSNICNFSLRVWREQYSTSWFTGFRIVLPVDQQKLEALRQ
jgi:serine/threonine protein kinase